MTALKVGVAPGADAESFFGMDLVGRSATTAADAAIGGAGSAAEDGDFLCGAIRWELSELSGGGFRVRTASAAVAGSFLTSGRSQRRFHISVRESAPGAESGNICSVPLMNWEDAKSCTPLKREFLREWFAQEQRFFLKRRSAHGLFYLDHRRSYDLDLFTTETVEGKEGQNLVLRVSAKIAAPCTGVQ